MLYAFDAYQVDTDRYELRLSGDIIPVEPRVFDLIVHFATQPDKVLTIDSLIENVWEGRIVSDATIASCVKQARKALNDTGKSRRYIETVRGRGFRFTADVSSSRGSSDTNVSQNQPLSAASTTQTTTEDEADPTIIILPFRCLSDDSSVVFAAAGIPNDLASILTRVPLLKQNVEGARYQGREIMPTAREIHEDLGVDFVLDGTSQQMGQKIRTNVQLANARTGMRVWAETFDHDLNVPDWQTQCVHHIIGKLEPQIQRAMHEVLIKSSTGETARQLYLQATGILIMNGWNHEAFPTAREVLRKSRQLNPSFALAPSLYSMLLGFGDRLALLSKSEDATAEALEAAEDALQLDNMDSTVLGLTGCCLSDIGFPDRGEALLRNAIDLNSANAQAWVALGAVRLSQGDIPDALEKLSHGIDISPLDSRLSIWGAIHAAALLASGDAEKASAIAEIACTRHDRTFPARVALAGARLAMGDHEKAKIAMAEATRIKPDLSERQIARLVGKELCAALTSR